MKHYFFLQFQRFTRTAKEIGLPPWVVCGGGIILFYFLSVALFFQTNYAKYLYPLLALGIVSRLGEKNRNDFLKNLFSRKVYRKIRLAENLLFILPFVGFLAYKGFYIISLLLLVSGLFLSLFNTVKIYSFVFPTPFSRKPFEFVTGFRKTFPVYLLAYFLAYTAVSADNFNLGVFAFLLLMFTHLSYYSEPEHEFYVWIYNTSPTKFLLKKMKTAFLFHFLSVLPIWAILLFKFSLAKIDIFLLSVGAGFFLLLFVIVAKYSSFPEKITLKQIMVISLCFLFPPMLLLAVPYFHRQSEKSLSEYLQ